MCDEIHVDSRHANKNLGEHGEGKKSTNLWA